MKNVRGRWRFLENVWGGHGKEMVIISDNELLHINNLLGIISC